MQATVAPALDEPPPRERSEGPLVALFVVLTLAASAWVLWRSEHHAVHDPSEKAARGEVQGLAELSLFHPGNLRAALAKVDASSRPLISNLRIAADRVSVTTRDSDGNRSVVNVDPGLKVTKSDFGVGEDYAVRASKVDLAAPERMVKAVAKKTGLPASAVDYVTVTFDKTNPATWYMALKQGPARLRQWVAEPDGSDLRKPGEPSTADKRKRRAERLAFERQQRRLQLTLARRSKCLSRARDADAVNRCLERYQPCPPS